MGGGASVRNANSSPNGSTAPEFIRREFVLTLVNKPVPHFLRPSFIMRLADESVDILDETTFEQISSIIYVDIISWRFSHDVFEMKVGNSVLPSGEMLVFRCRGFGQVIADNLLTSIKKLMDDMQTQGYTKESFEALKLRIFEPTSKNLKVNLIAICCFAEFYLKLCPSPIYAE
jgi:hypothetical protein